MTFFIAYAINRVMNWPNVIKEIQAHGITQAEIAEEIGTSQGHISDLLGGKRGKRLSYELGRKLYVMRERLAKQKEAA